MFKVTAARDPHTDAHSSLRQNCQNLEATQTSFSGWTGVGVKGAHMRGHTPCAPTLGPSGKGTAVAVRGRPPVLFISTKLGWLLLPNSQVSPAQATGAAGTKYCRPGGAYAQHPLPSFGSEGRDQGVGGSRGVRERALQGPFFRAPVPFMGLHPRDLSTSQRPSQSPPQALLWGVGFHIGIWGGAQIFHDHPLEPGGGPTGQVRRVAPVSPDAVYTSPGCACSVPVTWPSDTRVCGPFPTDMPTEVQGARPSPPEQTPPTLPCSASCHRDIKQGEWSCGRGGPSRDPAPSWLEAARRTLHRFPAFPAQFAV